MHVSEAVQQNNDKPFDREWRQSATIADRHEKNKPMILKNREESEGRRDGHLGRKMPSSQQTELVSHDIQPVPSAQHQALQTTGMLTANKIDWM